LKSRENRDLDKDKLEMTVMPCGIYCPGCLVYMKGKCPGGSKGCKKCKTIYECAKKKNIKYCFECNTNTVSFPCERFKQFNETWKMYGQNLIENQLFIKEYGIEAFLSKFKRQKL